MLHGAQTLSVVIPVKDGGATLPALLNALGQQQPVRGWRVEVVAGYTPSSDDTARILQERKIRFNVSEKLGPSAARNAGARLATGSLLYFIDADAMPVGDDFLRRLVHVANDLGRRGRLGAFGGPILLDPAQGANPVAVADHFACWFNWHEKRPNQRTKLFQPTTSLAMPHEVFRRLGGFNENIQVLEDFDLQSRMLGCGLQIYYINELRVAHRARGSLMQSWKHSWSWGLPYRNNYLTRADAEKLRFPLRSRWFFLNLPFFFVRRMRLVMRAAWRVSPRRALLTFPLIAATVFACALAVAAGKLDPAQRQS